MSLLRVDQLSPNDDSVILNVADLATKGAVISTVNDYASLRDITPTSEGQLVFIKGYKSGTKIGGGAFISVKGSATDNGGTICVPTGSAAYYWKRIFDGRPTLAMFGAQGDGVTDDTSAIQAAFTACTAIFAGAGTFIVSSEVTKQAGSDLSIFGAGPGATIFLCGASGRLAKAFGSKNGEQFHASDFSVQCSAVNGGAAIRCYRSDANVAFEDEININNIRISCAGGPHASSNTFKYGLRFEYVRFVKVSGCRIWGQEGFSPAATSTTNAAGISVVASDTVAQFGYTFEGNWVTSWSDLISMSGWFEGVYITGGEYWIGYNGFNLSRPAVSASTPIAGTVRISNVHVNASKVVFQITNCSTVGLDNLEAYIGVGGGQAGSYGIILNNCPGSTISACSLSNAYNVSCNGILIQSCAGVSINGVTVSDFVDSAVVTSGSSGLMIEGVTVLAPNYTTTNGIYCQTSTGVIGKNNLLKCTNMCTPDGCYYNPPTVRYTNSVTLSAGNNVVTVTPVRALSSKPVYVSVETEYNAAGTVSPYYNYSNTTTTGIVINLVASAAGTYRYMVEYPLV